MLQSVETTDSRYENLQNYILSGRKRPGEISGVVASPRFENVPGQETPSGKSPIPTSSQRPHKPTNQRIVYSRLLFNDISLSSEDAPSVHEIDSGDIVFVHKYAYTGRPGGGRSRAPNRMSSVLSLNMVNDVLFRWKQGYNMLDQTLADEIKRVRIELAELETNNARLSLEEAIYRHHPTIRHDTLWEFVQSDPPVALTLVAQNAVVRELIPLADMTDVRDVVQKKVDYLRKKRQEEAEKRKLGNGQYARPVTSLIPQTDWRAVPALQEFVLDGVVANVDKDDDLRDMAHRTRDEGLLFNVCIGGPTPCRNSKTPHQVVNGVWTPIQQETHLRTPQVIDDGCRAGDSVFVGLIAYEIFDMAGNITGFKFLYKCFSARQMFDVRADVRNLLQVADPKPGGLRGPPSVEEFLRMVGIWRLGRIMDDSLTRHPEQQIMLNVVIEEWPLSWIEDMFKPFPPGFSVLNPGVTNKGLLRRSLQPALGALLARDRDRRTVLAFTDAAAASINAARATTMAARVFMTANLTGGGGGGSASKRKFMQEYERFVLATEPEKAGFVADPAAKRVYTLFARALTDQTDRLGPNPGLLSLYDSILTYWQDPASDIARLVNDLADLRADNKRFGYFDASSQTLITRAVALRAEFSFYFPLVEGVLTLYGEADYDAVFYDIDLLDPIFRPVGLPELTDEEIADAKATIAANRLIITRLYNTMTAAVLALDAQNLSSDTIQDVYSEYDNFVNSGEDEDDFEPSENFVRLFTTLYRAVTDPVDDAGNLDVNLQALGVAMDEGFSDELAYVNIRVVFDKLIALKSNANFETSFSDEEKQAVSECDAHQVEYNARNTMYAFYNGLLTYAKLSAYAYDESVLVFS